MEDFFEGLENFVGKSENTKLNHIADMSCSSEVKPFPKQTNVFMCLLYKSFENTVGKGDIARNEQCLLFPQRFLPSWTTFSILLNLKLSFANSFSLEGSKICCLGKGKVGMTDIFFYQNCIVNLLTAIKLVRCKYIMCNDTCVSPLPVLWHMDTFGLVILLSVCTSIDTRPRFYHHCM